MTHSHFTVDDLKVILREGAGETDDVDLGGDILDIRFEALGYDSLALLETGIRIEGKYNISLGDSDITGSQTPRGLLQAVNALLPDEEGLKA